MLDWVPINWDLMKNPFNWVIIFLMVTIAAIPLALLHEHFVEQKTSP
jgi:hypothetical protein